MIEIKLCPVCGEKEFHRYLEAKDHTVSHETFAIDKCPSCTLLITSPRPEDDQLAKYYLSQNYISHSGRSKTIFDRIYRITRELTIRWKISLIRKHIQLDSISILDYGCGTGSFLQACQQKSWKISAVEPGDSPRKIAEQDLKIEIAPTLDSIQSNFDAITLWHVLEHVPDLSEKVSSLKEKLNKNGIIFIAVPNHESWDGKKYGSGWAGYDVPRHLWHFNRPSMTRLLNRNELDIIEIRPMKLDAFYVSMLSEKNKTTTNTFAWFLRGLINGLKSNFKASTTKEYSSLIYVAKKK